jgi:hypothetical protein
MTSKIRTGKKGYRFFKKNKDMLYDKQGLDDMETEVSQEMVEKMDGEYEKEGRRRGR